MRIDRDEMLRYMGFRGQQLTPENLRLFDEAERLCLDAARPKCAVKAFGYDPEKCTLAGTNVAFGGEDIKKHLCGCDKVYLVAVTLGLEVDRLTAKLMRENAALGVAVDSAAVCAVESYLDDVCDRIAAECGALVTDRFSCGYGDFPLEQQADFVRLLDMNRKLGVYLGKGNLMTPMKSVTAVVGVSGRATDKKTASCRADCANCALNDCPYRK